VLSVGLWLKRRDAAARITWTLACAFYLAHVVTAFQFHHHWSHLAAYRETARQTAEVFGLNWGGGLYFNYVFTLLWIADAAWWWQTGLDRYRCRPGWMTLAVHAFFGFMFLNATAVFGSGPMRWFGVAAALILALMAFAMTGSRSPGAILGRE
jgi:hypothetical protein